MSAISLRTVLRRCFTEVDVVASLRENFAANLTVLLEELRLRKILQKDVAARLGVSKAQLTHWKTGINMPEPETVEAIAEIGGLDDAGLLYISPAKFLAQRDTIPESAKIVAAIREGLHAAGYDVVKRGQ